MMSVHQISSVLVASSLPMIPRWWSKETVAIVTGANKGIGFFLVKRLAELGLTVVLTARDGGRGLEAIERLNKEGLKPHFYCLDVSDINSIQVFASWFHHTFGVVDILINNAGVSFNGLNENSVEHAETVVSTNFYGPKLLTEALMPMFRTRSSSGVRILNTSSRLGHIDNLRNPKMKEMLEDEENLSEEQIERMLHLFLESVTKGRWNEEGWPRRWTDYSVSKLALNSYTKLFARRCMGKGVTVNCFCPGFTRTSMTAGKGNHTAEDAAAFGAWVALLPADQLQTGKFYLAGSNPAGIYSKM